METQVKGPLVKSPSAGWYFVALAVFLLGIIFSICYLYKAFTQPVSVIEITPQTKTVHVNSPGKYTLWIIRSKSTEHAKDVSIDKAPALFNQSTISFKNTATGTSSPITLEKGWHFQTKETVRFSGGDVVFDKPGEYSVAIANPPKETFILYLHKPHFAQILKYGILSLVFLVLAIALSLLIALIVFIKRTNPLQSQPLDMESLKDQSAVGTGWAVACHLSGFAGFLFPFGNILVPLLLWAFKRTESPYIDFHGKEAINFQISVSIYYLICIILSVIIIGLLLMPLLAAFQIIAMIIAAISASHGNLFRYPLSLRFLK